MRINPATINLTMVRCDLEIWLDHPNSNGQDDHCTMVVVWGLWWRWTDGVVIWMASMIQSWRWTKMGWGIFWLS